MRTIIIVLCGCLLALAAGCENASSRIKAAEGIAALRRDKAQLENQVKQAKADNEQLKKQVDVLSKLEPKERFGNLYDLRKIEVTRYTSLYDKDRDGKNDTLIVYMQPMDEEGDVIKASGAVDVQLWDLNRQASQAMLGQWHVGPAELKKLWSDTLITISYRLTFDVADKVKDVQDSLVVKVTFTDYLSGKVFKEQVVIKP